jgi:hypothetical protein
MSAYASSYQKNCLWVAGEYLTSISVETVYKYSEHILLRSHHVYYVAIGKNLHF